MGGKKKLKIKKIKKKLVGYMKKNRMPVFRFPKCPLKFLKLWNMTCQDTRIFCPVLLECRKALRENL